jgi:hypothetical protein
MINDIPTHGNKNLQKKRQGFFIPKQILENDTQKEKLSEL